MSFICKKKNTLHIRSNIDGTDRVLHCVALKRENLSETAVNKLIQTLIFDNIFDKFSVILCSLTLSRCLVDIVVCYSTICVNSHNSVHTVSPGCADTHLLELAFTHTNDEYHRRHLGPFNTKTTRFPERQLSLVGHNLVRAYYRLTSQWKSAPNLQNSTLQATKSSKQ